MSTMTSLPLTFTLRDRLAGDVVLAGRGVDGGLEQFLDLRFADGHGGRLASEARFYQARRWPRRYAARFVNRVARLLC